MFHSVKENLPLIAPGFVGPRRLSWIDPTDSHVFWDSRMSRKGSREINGTDPGSRLARIRRIAGLSQRALARELGVTHRTVSYYELESRRIPSDLLVRAADVLGCRIEDILGLDADVDPSKILPHNRRLRRKLLQVEKLPRRAQNALVEFMDALLIKYPNSNREG